MIKTKLRTIGMIGVVAGFVGLLSVLVGPSLIDALFPKPPLEERVADKAVAIRDAVASRLRGETPPAPSAPQRFERDALPYMISLAMSAVAIIAGCAAYLRREDLRFAHVACGVGVLTLAWHAMLVAVGAVVFCIIIYAIIEGITGGG